MIADIKRQTSWVNSTLDDNARRRTSSLRSLNRPRPSTLRPLSLSCLFTTWHFTCDSRGTFMRSNCILWQTKLTYLRLSPTHTITHPHTHTRDTAATPISSLLGFWFSLQRIINLMGLTFFPSMLERNSNRLANWNLSPTEIDIKFN